MKYIKKLFLEQNSNPARVIRTYVHTSSGDPPQEVSNILREAVKIH